MVYSKFTDLSYKLFTHYRKKRLRKETRATISGLAELDWAKIDRRKNHRNSKDFGSFFFTYNSFHVYTRVSETR